jgi:hypothetical protein
MRSSTSPSVKAGGTASDLPSLYAVWYRTQLEDKSSDSLKDFDVLEKAKEGMTWCSKMTEVTGNTWKYKIIPHDKFLRNDVSR